MILILKCSFLWKKGFMALFYGWSSTSSSLRLEPLLGDSLAFNIKFPEITRWYSFLSTSEGRTTQITKSDLKKGVLIL